MSDDDLYEVLNDASPQHVPEMWQWFLEGDDAEFEEQVIPSEVFDVLRAPIEEYGVRSYFSKEDAMHALREAVNRHKEIRDGRSN